jgi:hypothetical protein
MDLDGGGWALAETNLAAAHEIGGAITVETLKASAVIGRRLGSVVGGEGFFRWLHGALTVVLCVIDPQKYEGNEIKRQGYPKCQGMER